MNIDTLRCAAKGKGKEKESSGTKSLSKKSAQELRRKDKVVWSLSNHEPLERFVRERPHEGAWNPAGATSSSSSTS
jgi:hypothetical protein